MHQRQFVFLEKRGHLRPLLGGNQIFPSVLLEQLSLTYGETLSLLHLSRKCDDVKRVAWGLSHL